jgi:hypothetical protein
MGVAFHHPLVHRLDALADRVTPLHALAMVSISEDAAAAIRAVFDQDGELSAAIEVRRQFPGITDNERAREWARTIVAWKPLPPRTRPRARKVG